MRAHFPPLDLSDFTPLELAPNLPLPEYPMEGEGKNVPWDRPTPPLAQTTMQTDFQSLLVFARDTVSPTNLKATFWGCLAIFVFLVAAALLTGEGR